MSAKNSDYTRVAELYGVIQETKGRVAYVGMDKEAFIAADTFDARILANGLLMCVFRATEEAGSMSEEARAAHPVIYWRGIKSMRNVLAHDYGEVDREAVWDSIEHDFSELERFCLAFAEENGIDLSR